MNRALKMAMLSGATAGMLVLQGCAADFLSEVFFAVGPFLL
jgi:hypothetical protein